MKKTSRALLNQRVKMRDGVELATHIYQPDADGPFPVMLLRTPYEAIGKGAYVLDWPQRGYAYVVQDVRGRFLSDGAFYPWLQEMDDAQDTLDWLQQQAWCNGNVAMSGGSYLGGTQNAAAMTGHPILKCFSPCLIGSEFYHTAYRGGAFRLGWQTGWTLKPGEGTDYDELNRTLPLIDMDTHVRGEEVPYWRDELQHPQYDEFWKATSMSEHIANVQAPAFIRTGWFDLFVSDVFDLFKGLREEAGDCARRHSRILVGPWGHGIMESVGEECFGQVSQVSDLPELEDAFSMHFTNGNGDYDVNAAPIRIFVMGVNQWRDEYEWPLARTVWTDFFLAGDGNANSSAGDGRLGAAPDGPADSFDYDPADPVPTKGGAWEFTNVGPHDQQEIERRSDVLIYTSDILTEDLEVIGPVELELFASSSARDTDFTAKLCDFRPDGKAMSITDGIVRARYRNGNEELLEPGRVYSFKITCNPTAYVFEKGHRIRLEVSSSNFPAFARNLNTGNGFAADAEGCIASQRIFHSETHPSKLVLPVIPNHNCGDGL